MNQIKLSLEISKNFVSSVALINQKPYFLFDIFSSNTRYFISISDLIVLKTANSNFFIIESKRKLELYNFLANYRKFLNGIKFPHKQIFILRGLGLKILYEKNTRSLEFKLGFSHKSIFSFSKEIFGTFKKRYLVLRSENIDYLANFSFLIRKLKRPDPYKGRGILGNDYKHIFKPVIKK